MQPINIIEGSWKQGTAPKVINLTGTAFMEEAGAHTFRVHAQDETGAAAAFTGTASALFLRADNTTVALDGEISDGAAEVTLVADCYHVPGRFSIAVYVSDGTDSTCVYAAVGNVYRTSSDVVIDSGATIPTLAQLEAAYAACVEATQDAEEAAASVPKAPTIEETTAEDVDLDLADAQGYVLARFSGGHIQTKNFDSADIPDQIAAHDVGFEYKFSGSDLLIGYGYNATHDAVVVLNCGRANGLFDFAKFALKTKGTSLETLETADLTTVWNSGTDMHSPFQFNATTDPDGYYSSSTDPSFTGGNHTVTIDGNAVQSASSEYVHYFADGKPVSTGYGRCARFEIRWANNVQAYNCVKADGTGRTSLVEYHDMIFDGVQFNEEIMLMPTEEISMRLWYGLQSVSWNQTYTSARFVDAENRGPFASTDSNVESGNAVTSGIIETGSVHSMEMTVDTGIDLGKRTFYSGTKGAFINRYDSNGKAYFSIIGGRNTWGEGEGYFLRGSFRFYPTVS